MGVQARLSGKPSTKDEESLPLTVGHDEGDQFKDHRPKRDMVGILFRVLMCMSAACYLVAVNPFDFPWPKPSDPLPTPGFIKEGIKQCEVIGRPPPHHKPATASRKFNDRFVEGTKPVWLRNATIWTGEEGGEEVLYGRDVLLDGGVIRKIGSSNDIASLVKGDKDVEEVQLGGAWLTPGRLYILSLNPRSGLTKQVSLICTLTWPSTRLPHSQEQMTPTRSNHLSYPGSDH